MATLVRQRNVLLAIVSVESALLLAAVWGAVSRAQTPGDPTAVRGWTCPPRPELSTAEPPVELATDRRNPEPALAPALAVATAER